MLKKIWNKKIIARTILGIGILVLGYLWFKTPAETLGWGLTILISSILLLLIIGAIKVFWTLLDWAFWDF